MWRCRRSRPTSASRSRRLAWVVNGYLIAFGGLLLLAGASRRSDRAPARLPVRPRPLHRRVAGLRLRFEPGAARRRALHPGRRRRAHLRRDPRHDRDDVPGAAGAGQGDRHLQLRGVRRRLDRPAGRRRPDPGDQLALDLLRQRPDRHRRPRCWRCATSRTTRASASTKGADVLGALLATAAVMLGVYTVLKVGEHGWTSAHTLAFGAASLALLAAFLTREARSGDADDPLRVFRSRNLSGASVTIVLMVAGLFGMFFLGVALPAADPRLRRDPDRPRLPARLAAHRRDVARRLGTAEPALRPARDVAPGTRAGGGCAGLLLPRTRGRRLRRGRAARRRPPRHRRRARVPGADDDLDVRRRAARRRPGLRRRQHEHAGRRRLRPRRPRHARDRPHARRCAPRAIPRQRR